VIGVTLTMIACAAEAARVVFTQVLVQKMPFMDSLYWSSPTLAMMSSLLSVIFEFPAMRETGALRKMEHPQLLLRLLGCCLLGGCVTFSSFWLTKLVGGLTMKVLVTARNVAFVLVSVFYFGEQCTAMQYLGFSGALIGLSMYERVKQQTPMQPMQKGEAETPTPTPTLTPMVKDGESNILG